MVVNIIEEYNNLPPPRDALIGESHGRFDEEYDFCHSAASWLVVVRRGSPASILWSWGFGIWGSEVR